MKNEYLYLTRENRRTSNLIDALLNSAIYSKDIDEIYEDKYLVKANDLIKCAKENNIKEDDNVNYELVLELLEDRYTCDVCGCHSNEHFELYRNNGSNIENVFGCALCNRLNDIDFYELKNSSNNHIDILESQGYIGEYKNLAKAINDVKAYCENLFDRLRNTSNEYIDSIKFTLNNSTEVMKVFNNELDKVFMAKDNSRLVYCNFVAEIEEDSIKLIAVFGYDYCSISDSYVISNNTSIDEVVDGLIELANSLGSTCKCA